MRNRTAQNGAGTEETAPEQILIAPADLRAVSADTIGTAQDTDATPVAEQSATLADTIAVESTAPTPVTPAHGTSEILAIPQSAEQSTSPTAAPRTAQPPELVNMGESVTSVAQSAPPLVLETSSGQLTCIGLETVVADLRAESCASSATTTAKPWSIFSPENRLRRLDDGGVRTIRRTSSILESGIRQIRRRLPSAYHPPTESLLPIRDTVTSLARRDFSLRKIRALRIIEEYGGSIPSPARISVDRKLQNEYRDNRASILKIKFVTNQWVVPRYIVEHFEKFHKPPFQPNGNVDEKRITDSITIVLKLSQPLFLTNTAI